MSKRSVRRHECVFPSANLGFTVAKVTNTSQVGHTKDPRWDHSTPRLPMAYLVKHPTPKHLFRMGQILLTPVMGAIQSVLANPNEIHRLSAPPQDLAPSSSSSSWPNLWLSSSSTICLQNLMTTANPRLGCMSSKRR